MARGRLPADRALDAVQRTVDQPPRYGDVLTTLCWGVAAGTSAIFFGGGWREVVVALVIGIITGLLSLIGAGRGLRRVLEPLAATLATLISVLAAWAMPPVSVYVATLAGIIVLIPGLTLTVAINELAMRHLVAGSTRARRGRHALPGDRRRRDAGQPARPSPASGAPTQLQPTRSPRKALAVLVSALAFAIPLQRPPATSDAILGACSLAFSGTRGGAALLDDQLGVAVGAFAGGRRLQPVRPPLQPAGGHHPGARHPDAGAGVPGVRCTCRR